MNKKTLKDLNFENKKVIVRFDFNVPIENNSISDDTRIKAALATIKYLQEHNAKIIMLSHLGRVKSEVDKKNKSLALVAQRLQELANYPVTFINETRGQKLETAISNLKAKDLLLIENTRFEDIEGKKESKNDPDLGKYWASLGDIFVNDAFGTAHRAHASNVGIATYIVDSCIGFLIEKELTMLNKIVISPARPFIAILGGAKVSDKINVIKQLLTKADTVIIGGAMSYTFMKALGYNIGTSLVENDKVELAKELIELGKDKLVLPIDYITNKKFEDVPGTNTKDRNIADDEMGLDIGSESQKLFQNKLQNAKTIFWNGPVGVFEMNNYATGTKNICQTLANLKDAFTLVGGGDSAAAIAKFNYQDKVSFISTGGGASLEYVEGKSLPGIEAIKNK